MNGQIRWTNSDRLSLEPGSTGWATTWVHLDVRTYNRAKFLKDSFFCKKSSDLDGKSLKELKKCPFQNTFISRGMMDNSKKSNINIFAKITNKKDELKVVFGQTKNQSTLPTPGVEKGNS
ncbi:hypothetical protein KJ966_06090 [bacterium]|nr:hypothetical protein [bacterium]